MSVVAIIAALFTAGHPGEDIEITRNKITCRGHKMRPMFYAVNCARAEEKKKFLVYVGDKEVKIETLDQ